MNRRFKADIVSELKESVKHILGKGLKPRRKPTLKKDGPILGRYGMKSTKLRANFRGTIVRAFVLKDGSVRCNGRKYNSPSLAAIAFTKRPTNGWKFWMYERAPQDWVLLDHLRK